MAAYIGITGFSKFAQVERLLKVWEENRGDSKRLFHLGVKMSHDTLHGTTVTCNDVLPPPSTIPNIFVSDHTYNGVHYADYKKTVGVKASLQRAIGYGGRYMHAIQLDMTWPDPICIERAKKASRHRVDVILQIGRLAFGAANGTVRGVVEKLRRYDGIIDRVLLDRNMGRGIGMDAEGLIPFVEAIKKEFPNLGIGAGGVLRPDTMDLFLPLIQEFPDISIDVQSNPRPGGHAHDPVDWGMAENYLIKALTLFK